MLVFCLLKFIRSYSYNTTVTLICFSTCYFQMDLFSKLLFLQMDFMIWKLYIYIHTHTLDHLPSTDFHYLLGYCKSSLWGIFTHQVKIPDQNWVTCGLLTTVWSVVEFAVYCIHMLCTDTYKDIYWIFSTTGVLWQNCPSSSSSLVEVSVITELVMFFLIHRALIS